MNPLNAEDLRAQTIAISEPFAKFLNASDDETKFDLSLLDVVRFSGHACIAITGAFLSAKAAIETLFPETKRCERGTLEIFMGGRPDQGATGPIANVLGFITGAWAESGFGGLNGAFARRNLLHFGADLPVGVIRFRRLDNGHTVDVSYRPSNVKLTLPPDEPFQKRWRTQISRMLEEPDTVVFTEVVRG